MFELIALVRTESVHFRTRGADNIVHMRERLMEMKADFNAESDLSAQDLADHRLQLAQHITARADEETMALEGLAQWLHNSDPKA